MHRVLNKELNKDVIDLRRKMYQENIIKTLKVWAPLETNFVLCTLQALMPCDPRYQSQIVRNALER